MKIFLQKDEEIFEKYGDEEAALYNMMLEMEKQEKQKKKAERDQRGEYRGDRGDKGDYRKDGGGRRDGRDRRREEENLTKEDAEKLGINFGKAPPRFQNNALSKRKSVNKDGEGGSKPEDNGREVVEMESPLLPDEQIQPKVNNPHLKENLRNIINESKENEVKE